MTDPYIYAALLCHKCNKPITEENLVAVMAQALGGSDLVDQDRVKRLVAALDGVDIEQALRVGIVNTPTGSKASEVQEMPIPEPKRPDDTDDGGLSKLFGD